MNVYSLSKRKKRPGNNYDEDLEKEVEEYEEAEKYCRSTTNTTTKDDFVMLKTQCSPRMKKV